MPGPFFPDIPEPPRRPRFSPEMSRRMEEAAIRAKAARRIQGVVDFWLGLVVATAFLQVLSITGNLEWWSYMMMAAAFTVGAFLRIHWIRVSLRTDLQLKEAEDGQV